MDTSSPLAIALLGASITMLGYFVSSDLERRKAIRLKEIEFRLDRYKEFLLSLAENSAKLTYESQLRFVNSVNVILLIGGEELLQAVKDLVDNYNDPNGTVKKQEPIMNRILFQMRRDLSTGTKHLADFEFPMIGTDIPPEEDVVSPPSE